MTTLIEELVDSDMPTPADREQYLGYARNVRAGHHDELDITGNAFSVKFMRDGVRIDSLWDENMVPQYLALDQFIAVISAWPTR